MNIQIDPRVIQSANAKGTNLAPDKTKNLDNLRNSTREFEAIYIFEMYKTMRKNVPDGGLLKKDMASKMYQEMMDMELARSTASGKGMGLGEAMYQQLKNHIK